MVCAVFRGKAKNMVDGTAAVSGSTMLTNVLDAPIAKLAMRNDIDASKDFVDAGTLSLVSKVKSNAHK